MTPLEQIQRAKADAEAARAKAATNQAAAQKALDVAIAASNTAMQRVKQAEQEVMAAEARLEKIAFAEAKMMECAPILIEVGIVLASVDAFSQIINPPAAEIPTPAPAPKQETKAPAPVAETPKPAPVVTPNEVSVAPGVIEVAESAVAKLKKKLADQQAAPPPAPAPPAPAPAPAPGPLPPALKRRLKKHKSKRFDPVEVCESKKVPHSAPHPFTRYPFRSQIVGLIHHILGATFVGMFDPLHQAYALRDVDIVVPRQGAADPTIVQMGELIAVTKLPHAWLLAVLTAISRLPVSISLIEPYGRKWRLTALGERFFYARNITEITKLAELYSDFFTEAPATHTKPYERKQADGSVKMVTAKLNTPEAISEGQRMEYNMRAVLVAHVALKLRVHRARFPVDPVQALADYDREQAQLAAARGLPNVVQLQQPANNGLAGERIVEQ